MTPTAVLVLVVGVLVVLAVAGAALALDARRRRPAPVRSSPSTDSPYTARMQTEPIDSVRAQEDPPTVMTTRGPDDEHPTVEVPRGDVGEVTPDVDPDGDAAPGVIERYGPGQGPGHGPATPSHRPGDVAPGSPRNGGPGRDPRPGPSRDPRTDR